MLRVVVWIVAFGWAAVAAASEPVLRLPSQAWDGTLTFDREGQVIAFADSQAIEVRSLPEGRLLRRIGLDYGGSPRRLFLEGQQVTALTGQGPYRLLGFAPEDIGASFELLINTTDYLQDAVASPGARQLALVFTDRVETFDLDHDPPLRRRIDAAWATAAIGRDGTLLVGTRDGVKRFEPGSVQPTEDLIGVSAAPYWGAPDLALSRDGTRVALSGVSVMDVSGAPAVRIFDMATGRMEAETAWPALGDVQMRTVADTANGFLAALAERRTEADGGWRLSLRPVTGEGALAMIELGAMSVSAVAVSPDGRYLAHTMPETVHVHDLSLGAATDGPVAQPRLVPGFGHATSISAMAATDGLIATADRDGHLWLWSPQNGRALGHVAMDARIVAMAFPDDPARLAVFAGGRLEVVDTRSRQVVSSVALMRSTTQPTVAGLVDDGRAAILCGPRGCSLHRLPDRIDRLPARSTSDEGIDLPYPVDIWDERLRGAVCGDLAVLALPSVGVILADAGQGRIAGPFAGAHRVRTATCTDTALWVGDEAGGVTRHTRLATGSAKLSKGKRVRLDDDGARPVMAMTPAGPGRLAVVLGGQGYVGRPDDPAVLLILDTASLEVLFRQTWPEGFAGRSAYIDAIAFGEDGASMAAASQPGLGTAPHLTLWQGQPLSPRHDLGTGRRQLSGVAFHADGTRLLLRSADEARLWSLDTGAPEAPIGIAFGDRILSHGDTLLGLSENGNSLLRSSREGGTQRIALPAGDPVFGWRNRRLPPRLAGDRLVLFSDAEVLVLDLAQEVPKVALQVPLHASGWNITTAVSADGAMMAVLEGDRLRLVHLEKRGETLWTQSVPDPGFDSDLGFSPDGRVLLLVGRDGVASYDAATGKVTGPLLVPPPSWEASPPLLARYDARRSGDSAVLVVPQDRNRALLHLPDAAPVAMPLGAIAPRHVILTEDHAMVAVLGATETLIWRRDDGMRSHLPAVPASGDGIALSRDGRHLAMAEDDGTISLWRVEDGARLARLAQLDAGNWAVVAPDGRYDAADPGDVAGLSWVMEDEPYRAVPVEVFYREFFEPRLAARLIAGEPLAPIAPPQQRNRVQPQVVIDDPQPGAGGDRVTVVVKASQVVHAGKASGLGVIKLFRDGQLVGQAPAPDGDPASVRAVFPDIRLPTTPSGQAPLVELSAYAFNADGIKSETARRSIPLPQAGAPAARRAFVLAIGVDGHADPRWDLRYAVADAMAHAALVSEGLRNGGQFDRIVEVSLLSARSHGHLPEQRHASRARIEAALAALGGLPHDRNLLRDVPGADALDAAGPEDLVYIAFAGHGMTRDDGQFHLFTQDLGLGGDIFTHSLDSDRLGDLVAAMDAREIVLVIDACHAAASIEGGGFVPGPMGSRGLGQLAYDKGIRVLAGSQAAEEALESPTLQHGVLSFAMLREGLEAGVADIAPRNGRISIGELVTYPLSRVPEIHQQVLEGRFSTVARGASSLLRPATDASSPIPGQTPALFDFRRLQGPEPELRFSGP